MSDVARVLNIVPPPTGYEWVGPGGNEKPAYIPAPPDQPSIQTQPILAKVQFHSTSDFEAYVRVSAPFTHTPEDARQQVVKTLQMLKPIKFPPLHERLLFRLFIDDMSGQNLKYTYDQICEVVDLASEYDLNFVVVAGRVKLGRMNAVQAMEAFGMYCCCEGDSRELQINPTYRRA